jgi:hypothetical protein
VNPYLPGLSFSTSPPVAYDKTRGHVFARRGWDDDDLWIGYLDGELQIFADGQRNVIEKDAHQAPLTVPGAAIVPVSLPMKFEVEVPPPVAAYEMPVIYVVGLSEGRTYQIRIGTKGRFRPYRAVRGGIISIRSDPETQDQEIDFTKPVQVEIRQTNR